MAAESSSSSSSSFFLSFTSPFAFFGSSQGVRTWESFFHSYFSLGSLDPSRAWSKHFCGSSSVAGTLVDVLNDSRSDFSPCFESVTLSSLLFFYLLVFSSLYYLFSLRLRRVEVVKPPSLADRWRIKLGRIMSVLPICGVGVAMLCTPGGTSMLQAVPRYHLTHSLLMLVSGMMFLNVIQREYEKGLKESVGLKIFLGLLIVVMTIKIQSHIRIITTIIKVYDPISRLLLAMLFFLYFGYTVSYVTAVLLTYSYVFGSAPRILVTLRQPLQDILLTSSTGHDDDADWTVVIKDQILLLRGEESEEDVRDAAGARVVRKFFFNGDRRLLLEQEDSCMAIRKKRAPMPEKKSSCLSRCYFTWMSSLIALGKSRPLTEADLYNLNRDEKARNIFVLVEKLWREEELMRPRGQRSIVRVYRRAFGYTVVMAGMFKLIYDCLLLLGPVLLNLIITFLKDVQNSPSRTPMWHGYFYVLLMLVANIIQSIVLQQYFHKMFGVGLRLRSSLSTLVFAKTLRMAPGGTNECGPPDNKEEKACKTTTKGEAVNSSSGGLVNLISVDSQRLQDLMTYLHILWSAPFQIIIALFLLYRTIGFAAFGGLAVMAISIPMAGLIAKRSRNLQNRIMKIKDERIKVTNEILSGIKIVKMYAWEDSFTKKVMSIREAELERLWQYQITIAFSRLQWMAVPCVVSVLSFLIYVLAGNELDAATAFTALALFNILRFPMQLLPYMVNNLVECNVALNRINLFLETPELDPVPFVPMAVPFEGLAHQAKPPCLSIEGMPCRQPSDEELPNFPTVVLTDSSFSWPNGTPLLERVTFECRPGTITAIIGSTGCGKSGLMSAIIGDLPCRAGGRIHVRGRVAYCSQVAWIQTGTLQDNICFGNMFDPVFYHTVLSACALQPDLDVLPAGDMTEIGEKGINLSGGQKQRVALARAVYQNADVYVLDDCLSAVDAHVATELCQRCFKGVLARKTILLVTHKLDFLPECDQILFVKDKRILFHGEYSDLVRLAEFDVYSAQLKEDSDEEDAESTVANETDEDAVAGKGSGPHGVDLKTGSPSVVVPTESTLADQAVSKGTTSPHSPSTPSVTRSRSTTDDGVLKKKVEGGGGLVEEEYVEHGKVSRKVYLKYLEGAGGRWVLLAVIVTVILANASQIGGAGWLSYWSDYSVTSERGVVIYSVILMCQLILNFLSVIYIARASQKAARFFHLRLLRGVFRAPMSFFESTPLGRLINRFARDTYVIDELLPSTFVMYINNLFLVVSTFIVIMYVTPLFLFVAVPLLLFYVYIQLYYISSSRQLQRVESVSRSPILAQLAEAFHGASTIRAFRKQKEFFQINQHRVDDNCRAYYHYTASNRWLAMRLELVGTLVISFASLFCIVASGILPPGLGGLAISYGLNVTQTLNWLVRMASDLESNSVSVERVVEYAYKLPREGGDIAVKSRLLDHHVIDYGHMEFRNFGLRYRENSPFVLRHINLIVNAGEKIGIVGRTGAGKSSMLMGLLRIVEGQEGSILIDGQDIKQMDLHSLRQGFSIIPQDPILFSGSIRFNLDPFQEYSDSDIWIALEQAHLKSFVSHQLVTENGVNRNGLDALVEEGGRNFSVGQRQLLCLSRALLRHSKILLLDEATSVVDPQTDKLIQQSIQREFASSTILTIAHRLNTIMDYNRVIVLDKGRVREFDSPKTLLNKKGSMFHAMALGAGIDVTSAQASTAKRSKISS